jgi:hypothetical protein
VTLAETHHCTTTTKEEEEKKAVHFSSSACAFHPLLHPNPPADL